MIRTREFVRLVFIYVGGVASLSPGGYGGEFFKNLAVRHWDVNGQVTLNFTALTRIFLCITRTPRSLRARTSFSSL